MVESNQRLETVVPFIGGQLAESFSEAAIETRNPSNGRAICTIPVGAPQDIDVAVRESRASFEDGRWDGLPPSKKKKVLRQFSEAILKNAPELDRLDALEMGKPVSESFANAAYAASVMNYYAEAIDKLTGLVFPSDKTTMVIQSWVPRGVVGAIIPWNFPTTNFIRKCAPALAAGNSVVVKPSELSSQSAMRLARLALEAGLPPGVLNIVPGLGDVVGKALATHPDVDMLSFTGSTRVGKAMLRYSGESNMKVVLAECGGKSPQIVFDDGIDLDDAAEAIGGFLVTNQGQICSVGSRLIVERSIEKKLVDKIIQRIRRIRIGDAVDPETTFGPLASEQQCKRVTEYIEAAKATGEYVLVGGNRTHESTGGYFVEPTIFTRVSPGARIAQEEIFGPILVVMPFDSEAEAVNIANDVQYGLSAYVWTANLPRGFRLAKSIRSSVWVNACKPTGEGAGHSSSIEPAKLSGIGTEGGMAGMESYCRRHLISFAH